MLGSLERIGSEVKQRRQAQLDHGLLPDAEAFSLLLCGCPRWRTSGRWARGAPTTTGCSGSATRAPAADEELDRLSSPIGLDLGARTPEETAVSIAAEIVARQWGGTGHRLATSSGRIHQDPHTPLTSARIDPELVMP